MDTNDLDPLYPPRNPWGLCREGCLDTGYNACPGPGGVPYPSIASLFRWQVDQTGPHPLVINTHGWINGVGWSATSSVLRRCLPDVVLGLFGNVKKRSAEGADVEACRSDLSELCWTEDCLWPAEATSKPVVVELLLSRGYADNAVPALLLQIRIRQPLPQAVAILCRLRHGAVSSSLRHKL